MKADIKTKNPLRQLTIGLYRRFVQNGALSAVLLSTTALFLVDRTLETFSAAASAEMLSMAAGVALWGGHSALQLIFAAVFVTYSFAAETLARRSPDRFPAFRTIAVGLGLTAVIFFFRTGRDLAGGGWISQQSYAVLLGPFAGLFGAGLFYALSILCNSIRRTVRTLGAITCGFLSIAVSAADKFAYPGIYTSLHHLAYGVSAAGMFLCWATLLRDVQKSAHPFYKPGFSVVAIATLTAGLLFFGLSTEKMRSELVEKSQTATYLLFNASGGSQPARLLPILERIAEGRPVVFDRPRYPAGMLRIPDDWNIITIVVDAMRADTLLPNRTGKRAHAKSGDTPFMDKWVSGTFQFPFAYSPSNKTERSMPTIFSGLYPTTLRQKPGVMVSKRMSAAGHTPIAVVNQLFASKKRRGLNALLSGFKNTVFYSDRKQIEAVPTMLAAVDRVASAPFFAWFHFYCLHNPYYAEKGIQKDTDGPFRERYRRALRWLDGQLKRLLDGLEKKGLTEKTVVVLTADHGEGLGDHRLETHGSYIFDEETRVPLYIHIPGQPGGRISETVHLVDLVPTLLDLIGRSAGNLDGESLVPLMVENNAGWGRDYYLENSMGSHMGVVRGRDKLVFFRDSDTLFRYDLIREKIEKKNAYAPKETLDRLLTARLIYYRPDLFIDELNHFETRDQFGELYRKVDTLEPDAAALLRRIAQARSR